MDYVLRNKLKVCRAEVDISQDTLAALIGTTRQTIANIEKGQCAPSIVTAYKLALYFKKNIEDIFYLELKEENKCIS